MIILTPELKKKYDIVKQYKLGIDKFKENTPDYVFKYDEEIKKYYDTEE